MAQAGFDMARYPGDAAIRWLWDWRNTNLNWLGFYLAVTGAGFADKKTWQGKFGLLKSMGWGVAPIYVGKQPGSPKLKSMHGKERLEGYKDGIEAASLAKAEKIPERTILYFDYEPGDQMSEPYLQYQMGWIEAVRDQGYRAGIYCSYLVGPQYAAEMPVRLKTPDVIAGMWLYNVRRYASAKGMKSPFPTDPPSQSGFSGATAWQLAHGKTIRVDGKPLGPIDFSSALSADPGNP